MTTKPKSKPKAFHAALGLLGLTGLLTTGCRAELATIANAQSEPRSTPTRTPLPTFTPSPLPPTATPTALLTPTPPPTATPWPSPTPWPTATPWSAPVAWQPVGLVLPTVAPLPVVPTSLPAVALDGAVPLNYAPPNEVDVAGNVMLRWDYPGLLAEDEYFDIKIKPHGSENSAFVDWSKTPEYELRPWSGWTPGLYTWQIGIIKGQLEGETKHFIADTGRDSAKFVMKWHAAGEDGSHGGGGGGRSGGS